MRNTLWTVLAGLTMASATQAAVVTYTLTATGGTYTVTATDTTQSGETNNFGIAGYGFTLSNFTTLVVQAPQEQFYNPATRVSRFAGFTESRTDDGVNPSGAGQGITSSSSILVYGIGQQNGTLATVAPAGSIPLNGLQEVYTNPLVVATGTYTGTAPLLTAGKGTIFTTNNTNTVKDATIALVNNVPEPTTLGIAGLALAGLVRRRRLAV